MSQNLVEPPMTAAAPSQVKGLATASLQAGDDGRDNGGYLSRWFDRVRRVSALAWLGEGTPSKSEALDLARRALSVASDGSHQSHDARESLLCRAVRGDAGLLAMVRQQQPALMTPKMVREAMLQGGRTVLAPWAIAHATQEVLWRDQSLVPMAVAADGMTLGSLPWDFRLRRDLCEVAVRSQGQALQFVPPQHRDYDMLKLAVASDGLALMHIERHLRSTELCALAFSSNPQSIRAIPAVNRTDSMLLSVAHLAASNPQQMNLLQALDDFDVEGDCALAQEIGAVLARIAPIRFEHAARQGQISESLAGRLAVACIAAQDRIIDDAADQILKGSQRERGG